MPVSISQLSRKFSSENLRLRRAHGQNNARIRRIAGQVAVRARPDPDQRPVVFFNASTRISGLSLNAAYQMLIAWSVRLAGVPVLHYVCQRGLSRCVLGTDRDQPEMVPPCRACLAQSRAIYSSSSVREFSYSINQDLARCLDSLDLAALQQFEYGGLPLGCLVLPSLRWVLRRHHLQDDESTRFLACQYIQSAFSLAKQFEAFLTEVRPQAVLVFNGQFYPEATVRWVAQQQGIRSFTQEVGLRPMSVFLTPGEATAYPIDIPPDFELTSEQNRILDEYLGKRFQGDFSMAGIRFWPQISGLDSGLLKRAEGYSQIVPVFTNVIFDTSQPHSNVVFPHMFAWLDEVLVLARYSPQTLFIIRAHPDEKRPGKESRESVHQWIERNQIEGLPNIVFVDAQDDLSSYELIQRAKFVMVYNSTIGLEASILGVPVLCAGRARYTQLPTVFFPPTPTAFRQQAQEFLSTQEIRVPIEFQRNARCFLYYQVFKTSLPLGDYLEEDGLWPGFVRFKDFAIERLLPENSDTLRVIRAGLLEGKEFLLEG